MTAVKGYSFERSRQPGAAKSLPTVASSITLPPLSLPGTTSLVNVPPPAFGQTSFPPVPLAKQAASAPQATGNALIARVLPTVGQQQSQVPSSLGTQTIPAPQGSMDSFTAQYAPETYKVALESTLAPSIVASSTLKEPTSTAQSVQPTYGGTDIPYFDHEIEKIQAAQLGNATLTAPLPTFASDAAQAAATQASTPQTQPQSPTPSAPPAATTTADTTTAPPTTAPPTIAPVAADTTNAQPQAPTSTVAPATSASATK